MKANRSQQRVGIHCFAAGVAWVLTYFGARMALEALSMSRPLRAAVALVPVVPFALFLLAQARALRGLDELERRIQLEALALAFPAALLLLMTLGLLQLAIPLSPNDWSYRHIWPFLFLFYFVGLARAKKRYQ